MASVGGQGQAAVQQSGPGQTILQIAKHFVDGKKLKEGMLNRVEAVLVSADGGGQWRFSLASGPVKAGSLRVVAGEPVAHGPATVAFAVEGQPGERIVFSFDRE